MNTQQTPLSATTPPEVSPSVKEYRFPLVIFLLGGVLAGVGFVLAYMSGLFEEWHQLNPPPSKPVEFLGISVYFYQADPYLRGEDGRSYFCDIQPGSVESQPICTWRIEPPPLDIVKPACQPGGIKFSFFWQPFNKIADCTEVVMAGEFIGAPKVTYVIDEHGSLYNWTQENHGNTIFYLPLGIILGTLAGYLAALLWSPLMGVIHKSPPQYWKALSSWEARILRWGGRLLSIPCLLYFIIRFLISWREFPPADVSGYLVFLSVALALIGLVIGWRWEITGGIFVLLAYLFAVPSLLESTSLPLLLGSSLPYLPGLLFLLAGILKHYEHREKTT